MLSSNGIKSARLLCASCRYLRLTALAQRPLPSISTPRQFHATQNNRGILERVVKYLSGDINHEKLHKEIGKMLEEYDASLLKSYNQAYDSYNKAYYTGARKDLLEAFNDVAILQAYTLRMEVFAKNNDFLKRTKVAEVMQNSDVQQNVKGFLEAMDLKYGDDVQYQKIVGPTKVQQKYKPMDLAGPFHGGKISGYLARFYGWIREMEMERLDSTFKQALLDYDTARSTGRRRDILKALSGARSLEFYMQERYEGKFWDEEQVAGRMDVRFERSEEDKQRLNKLKGDINVFIKQVKEEFEDASKPGGIK